MKRSFLIKRVFLIAVMFAIGAFASSCAKNESSNISADAIIAEVKELSEFKSPKQQSLLDEKVAEQYGIPMEALKEGMVYYEEGSGNFGKIIVAVAKDSESLQKIEQAFASEKVKITNALEKNQTEQEKIKNIIVKTKGNYCILIFSNNSSEIEKIFDKAV